jgi:hypothetical protein
MQPAHLRPIANYDEVIPDGAKKFVCYQVFTNLINLMIYEGHHMRFATFEEAEDYRSIPSSKVSRITVEEVDATTLGDDDESR